MVVATSGWYDHGAGDFSDNHHYASPQCGAPFYSLKSHPYDPTRIGIQGEFGGIGNNVSINHLWNVQEAIDTIDRTYEIDTTLDAWRYRGHELLGELRAQIEMYACSGAIWTQTTDVEGEVNVSHTNGRETRSNGHHIGCQVAHAELESLLVFWGPLLMISLFFIRA